MKIIKAIKQDFNKKLKKQPFSTLLMAGLLTMSILSFLKPSITSPLVELLKIQMLFLIFLGIAGFFLLYWLKTRGFLKNIRW